MLCCLCSSNNKQAENADWSALLQVLIFLKIQPNGNSMIYGICVGCAKEVATGLERVKLKHVPQNVPYTSAWSQCRKKKEGKKENLQPLQNMPGGCNTHDNIYMTHEGRYSMYQQLATCSAKQC